MVAIYTKINGSRHAQKIIAGDGRAWAETAAPVACD
jgi:hypothetical protein